MLTESPRVIFSGQGPGPNCNRCGLEVQMVRGVGLPEVVRRFVFWGESPLTNCNRCIGKVKMVRGGGLRWQLFFYAGLGWRGCRAGACSRRSGRVIFRIKQKGALPRGNAPTRSSYHASRDMSTINGRKVPESLFYTKLPEAFCAVFRLVKWHMPW